MKIGIDASSLIRSKTGIGSFAHSFFEALKEACREDELFFYQPKNQQDFSTPQRVWWETVTLPALANRDHVDILYTPGFAPPRWGHFCKVVTVHDIIGVLHPANNRGLASRWYWSQWLPESIRRADVCVASSEATKKDMVHFLGLDPASIEVVPLAVNLIFSVVAQPTDESVLQCHGITRPYIIAVGTLEPRKNHARLLEAFARIALMSQDIQLVIIGKDGGMLDEITKKISQLKLGSRVKMIGYVTDERLAALYRQAVGYAAVSLLEGFGLPALEAMSSGITGVVAQTSSLPEVVGETAVLVNPESVESIAQGLSRLVGDAEWRREYASKALARSKLFSYQITADKMHKVFQRTQ